MVNSASSDEDEIEPRSSSRPSSMYSEGAASVESGGIPEVKTETKTDITAELASITAKADPEKQRRARRLTKKGMMVNPDYL